MGEGRASVPTSLSMSLTGEVDVGQLGDVAESRPKSSGRETIIANVE